MHYKHKVYYWKILTQECNPIFNIEYRSSVYVFLCYTAFSRTQL